MEVWFSSTASRSNHVEFLKPFRALLAILKTSKGVVFMDGLRT